MIRLLSDENFNGDIIRGLTLRRPEIHLVRVQDVGLESAEDPEILSWAAENDRIILTHDRATMPNYAYELQVSGERMSGVFIVNNRRPVREAIEELLLIDECSEQTDWTGLVVFLPL